jgi:hypothetical protein
LSIELSSTEIIDLRQRTWSIFCPKITLKQRSDHDPGIISGCGYVKLLNNELVYELYIEHRENVDKSPEFQAGDLLPDEALYDLYAQDSQGREWVASRLSCPSVPILNPTISGAFHEISFRTNFPTTKNSLKYWVLSNIAIPLKKSTHVRRSTAAGYKKSKSSKLDAWKFRTQKINFFLHKEDDDLLTIQASSDQQFSKRFDKRFLEALQFVLGHPIPWSIKQEINGSSMLTTISGQRISVEKSDFPPPLPLGRSYTIYHTRLFARFLKYILKSSEPNHPIWGKLFAAYEAGTKHFNESRELTLTVSIESLLNTEFPELNKQTKAELRAIADAKEYMESWDGPKKIKKKVKDKVKKRIKSTIRNLERGPSAKTRLGILKDRGAIMQEYLKAWEDLRHPNAHKYQATGISGEKAVKLTEKIETLLYQLIFYRIDYKGFYQDKSLPDWPIKNYPPLKEEEG